MLQNINILAGPVPRMTGSIKQDQEAVERYLARLARALEYSLEQIDKRLEAVEQNG